MSGGTAPISTALATRSRAVAADVARDLAAAGRVADVDGVLQVERLDERGEVVGVRVHVVAVPRLARAAVAAAVVGDARGSRCDAKKNICSSQASALSGQPWLKTTGCPVPQSL